nr:hypothetical protein GCM10020092_029780 [Actinoplanes digitatis]
MPAIGAVRLIGWIRICHSRVSPGLRRRPRAQSEADIGFLPSGTDLAEDHRGGRRAHQHLSALDEQLPGREGDGGVGDRADRSELEALVAQGRPRAGRRGAGADPAVDGERRIGPADPGVVDRDLRRHRDAVERLRVRPRGLRLDRVEDGDEQAGALGGEPSEQVAGGVHGPDPLGQRAVDRAGVQAGLELEHAGAGHLVAVQDGVLHGRGAAPGGQQGEVQVDPAVLGDLQRFRRHQGAVGDHGHAGGRDLAQPLLELRLARALRGEHLDAALVGPGTGRGAHQATAPARGGASGRVSTAAISCEDAASASSEGTATSGGSGEDDAHQLTAPGRRCRGRAGSP